MEKPISVGDLVEVVRPRGCCPEHSRFGMVFVVADIHAAEHPHAYSCAHCGAPIEAARALPVDSNKWFELSRLKRIPPLGELDGCSEDARQGQNDKVSA